jgi:hypothetical protein
MNRTALNPFQYFALHSLTRRRPLFRWEREAVTPEVMESLRKLGFVELMGDDWILTELGALALSLDPTPVLGRVPRASKGVVGDDLAARRAAKRGIHVHR